MKLAVLIIGQNQNDYIGSMLEKLTGLEADRYWVLDRCTDSSEDWLRQHGEANIIVNTAGTGFLAGRMRDLGIEAAFRAESSQEPYDTLMFLDGDRLPIKPLKQSSLVKAMRRWDVALCPLESDARPFKPYSTAKNFEPNQFISCGFIIKAELVKTIQQLPFMEGRLFHKSFDGVYGYEDGFLGKLLLDMACSIGWSDVIVKGGIVFDDFSKMSTLLDQAIKYDTLSRQFRVKVEAER